MHPNWRKDVFTVREASTVLQVSVSTVRRMLREDILTASPGRMGAGRGVIVIPRDSIEHYIESLKSTARRSIGV